MKFWITSQGDKSVGIWGDDLTINWDGVDASEFTKPELERMKRDLGEFFYEFLDNGRVQVGLEGEDFGISYDAWTKGTAISSKKKPTISLGGG
jgi:hypothetical protein